MTKSETLLIQENENLKNRLHEAEDALRAIRNGEVDAIIVSGDSGEKIFSLTSAETPYRIIIEQMEEGAVVLSESGNILYCNPRFSSMAGLPSEKIIGSNLSSFIEKRDLEDFSSILSSGRNSRSSGEFALLNASHKKEYCLFTVSKLPEGMSGDVCVIISTITEIKKFEKHLSQLVRQRTHELEEANHQLKKDIEYRIESEIKITESEHIMSYFLEAVPVGVIRWGMDGIIHDANDRFLEMISYTRDDFENKRIDWLNLTPPEYSVRDKQAFEEYFTSGKCFPYEKAYYRKDGSVLPIMISSVMVSRETEEGIGFVLDLTEIKKKEADLVHNKSMMAEAQRIANFGSWDYEFKYNKILWSEHLYRIFGKDPETFAPTLDNLFSIIHPDDREFVKETISASINNPTNYDMEYRIIKDWEIRNIQSRGVVISENGIQIRLIGTSVDITERKKSEKEILLLANIIELSTQSIAIIDLSGKISFSNNALENLTKYSKDELSNISLTDTLTAPEYQEMELIIKDEVLKTGEALRYENEHIRKDGSRIPVEVLLNTKKDENGISQFFFAFISDITERKKNEDNLHQMIRTLRAMQKSSQIMVHAKTEQKFLEDVCKVVLEDCGHKMIWIGYKSDNEEKTVIPVAFAGFEEDYLNTLKITWEDSERGNGPTGTAIRTGKVAMCKNMLTDPKFEPWKEEAVKRGYASSIALPLYFEDSVFGAMAIYSTQPDPFSDEEQQLLMKLADDLAYGVSLIRLNIALKKAKSDLEYKVEERTSLLQKTMSDLDTERQRFQDVLNMIPAYVILVTPDLNITFSNKIFKENFGDIKKRVCGLHPHAKTDGCEICDVSTILKTLQPRYWEWTAPNEKIYQVADFPFTDNDGAQLILEMGIDITDKKNIEKYVLSKILETEEKDRRRFASDLHDDLGPTMSAIKLQLSLLSSEETQEERDEVLNICDLLLSEGIDKMRTLANNIMPSLIESYGLETAVKSFTNRMQKMGQISFHIDSNMNGFRFDGETELHLYRVVTELINNTIKHSGASDVYIELIISDNNLKISYSDNGIGYSTDINPLLTNGIGLQNINNRITLLSGTIDFQKKNNKTVVVINKPLG